MNKIGLNGRMASDVDYRDGEKPIARFTVAVNRIGKDEADFIRCVAFGKTAEYASNYLKKGEEVTVDGRIQTGSYEKDGRKIYTTEVVVDTFKNINSVVLKGRLTADPEIREGETMVARYSLAVDRRTGDADFIRCVAFGKTAEFVSNYLKKGQEICVIGHLQINSYTDKDGNKTSSADVIVSNHEFCGKKED